MREWSDFFVAEVGASAALTGLLFVAVSINLGQILKYPHLPTRALEALATLLCVLVISTFALVPEQTAFVYGLEMAEAV
jgi:MFS-type transporter involved in bile tolerance (Atg22 family)